MSSSFKDLSRTYDHSVGDILFMATTVAILATPVAKLFFSLRTVERPLWARELQRHEYRSKYNNNNNTQRLVASDYYASSEVVMSHRPMNHFSTLNREKVTAYLNRQEVQEALHASLVGVAHWSTCSE
ncbi:hypothetical protein Fmac_005745 [Flemingia macrophylla]|uniref:Uncharacterized protein n=1 Tax=Flemingia macrophylla TaxID=520843 RepID=A0ABD1N8M4_9FABA